MIYPSNKVNVDRLRTEYTWTNFHKFIKIIRLYNTKNHWGNFTTRKFSSKELNITVGNRLNRKVLFKKSVLIQINDPKSDITFSRIFRIFEVFMEIIRFKRYPFNYSIFIPEIHKELFYKSLSDKICLNYEKEGTVTFVKWEECKRHSSLEDHVEYRPSSYNFTPTMTTDSILKVESSLKTLRREMAKELKMRTLKDKP